MEKGWRVLVSFLGPGPSTARDDGIFPDGLFRSRDEGALSLAPQSFMFRRLSFPSGDSCASLYQPFLTLLPATLHPNVEQGSDGMRAPFQLQAPSSQSVHPSGLRV